MRISDWSSDVCSSDLAGRDMASAPKADRIETSPPAATEPPRKLSKLALLWGFVRHYPGKLIGALIALVVAATATLAIPRGFMLVIDKGFAGRSEEHTSELQSLMSISYAVSFLKTK